MARLIVKSNGFQNQILELHLGTNRVGRSPENHFQLDHPTISALHCEIAVANGHIIVRDCGSTNGTFVGGKPVQEAQLIAGETLGLGDVELFVESTELVVAVPRIEVSRPAPPVVLNDGGLICPRHPRARATYQCTHCREILCDGCVHLLRRRGGKVLKLCPLCSHKCEPIGDEKKKKRSLLGFLQKTVKLPFLHVSKEEN